MLDRYFHLNERHTTVGQEVRAGLVTFLTLAYIVFVNPQVLAPTGMPLDDVLLATALASAFATLVMGLVANVPLALAPGLGLAAYFTFGVVLGMDIPWQGALAAVAVAGGLFVLLVVTGARKTLMLAVPDSVQRATAAGIGLFLALIGMRNAGWVVAHPETLVALGDLRAPEPILALVGLVGMVAMLIKGVRGAILIAFLGVTGASWALGVTPLPESVFSLPRLPEATLFALDFTALLSPTMVGVVVALFLVNVFDTVGITLGLRPVCQRTGAPPVHGDRVFLSGALGTIAGGVVGTGPLTIFAESASGMQEGGRTGLTSVVTGLCFLGMLFLVPVASSIPVLATAPVLILIGIFLVEGVRQIMWERFDEALPAFLTLILMPFTFSIVTGITFGLLSHVMIYVLTGRAKKVAPLTYALTLVLTGLTLFMQAG